MHAVVSLQSQIRANSPDLDRALRTMAATLRCPRCATLRQTVDSAETQHARIARLTSDTYAKSLMPHEARKCTYTDSYEDVEMPNQEHWNRARAVPIKTGLWLKGKPGVGKTFFARCILNAHLAAHYTAAEIGALHLDAVGSHFQWEAEIKPYTTPYVLLIDDLDKPSWTPAGLNALWALCDKRMANDRRTIITANQTPEGIRNSWRTTRPDNASMAATIFERLLPMEQVELRGESLRRNSQCAK